MRKFHIIALALCMLAAGLLFRDFLPHSRSIWTALLHDRVGHYDYGLDMAVELERGHVGQFFGQLEKGKVWPPLHGLLVALTQVISDNDWHMAVLPSLAGWFLVLWCVWYTAQKIATPTGFAWEAGVVGLIFALISPGERLYATDIMLESLGGGLTMVVLACYARATEERESESRWRALAFALTLLFFEKYNYWMIVTAALVLAERGTLLAIVRPWLQRVDFGKSFRAQLREPLNWVILFMAVFVAWLFAHGPTEFMLRGHRVSLYPPHNLVTVTYALFFIRVALAIRRSGWKPRTAQERMLWRWQVLPIAISFLLPQRLSLFIGFLSPTNNDVVTRNLPGTLKFYADAFANDYHPAPALAILAVALALIALTRFKTLGPAARSVLLCMLIGATLNILHPNQKSRFLHSWIPTVWTAAGLGAAILFQRIPGRRPLVAGAGVAALALAGMHAWTVRAAAAPADPASQLDMSDEWLADVADAHRVAFLSTQTSRGFMEWTFLADHRPREQFEWPAWQGEKSEAAFRAGFEAWIKQTKADAIVVLDVPVGSREFTPLCDVPLLRENLASLLAKQTRFKPAKEITFSEHGSIVKIWRAD